MRRRLRRLYPTPPVSSRTTMTMRRIVSMVTSQRLVELARACLGLLLVSLAAGEGVGGLVHGFLGRALGLVDAPFVLQASVSGQRAGGLLHATLRLIDVLVGHETLLTCARVGASGGCGRLAARSGRPRTGRGPRRCPSSQRGVCLRLGRR